MGAPTPRRRTGLALLFCAAALLATACGEKKPAANVDAAAEREAALERARHDKFGTQVQALDKAKGLEADVNKKAQDSVDNAEKDAK
ncbi:MAG TPA: hypothetical protein VF386_00340 [Usitatibacter sp.]